MFENNNIRALVNSVVAATGITAPCYFSAHSFGNEPARERQVAPLNPDAAAENNLAFRTDLFKQIRDCPRSDGPGQDRGQFIDKAKPLIRRYIESLKSAPDLTLRELQEAASYNISSLNVTRYSTGYSREDVDRFLIAEILDLHQTLIKCAKEFAVANPETNDACLYIISSVKNDLLWSAAHRPSDKEGVFAGRIWDKCARIISEEFLATEDSFKPGHLTAVLTYHNGVNPVVLRIIAENREKILLSYTQELSKISFTDFSKKEEALEAIIAVNGIIASALKSADLTRSGFDAAEFHDWYRREIDDPLVKDLAGVAVKILWDYAKEPEAEDAKIHRSSGGDPQIAWLTTKLTELKSSPEGLNRYLASVSDSLSNKDLPPQCGIYLYQTLNLIGPDEINTPVITRWAAQRVTEEKNPLLLNQGLGPLIGRLYLHEFLNSGTRAEDPAGITRVFAETTGNRSKDLMNQVRPGHEDNTVDTGGFGEAQQLLGNLCRMADSGYAWKKFYPGMKIETAADIEKIHTLRRSSVLTVCSALDTIRSEIERIAAPSAPPPQFFSKFIPIQFPGEQSILKANTEIRNRAMREFLETTDKVFASLKELKGGGINNETLPDIVIALLQSDAARYDNMAKFTEHFGKSLEELRKKFPEVRTDTDAPFTNLYSNLRLYLYSETFGQSPQWTKPSPASEKIDNLCLRAAWNQQDIFTCRLILTMLGEGKNLRPLVIHQNVGESRMKNEALEIAEKLGLLKDSAISYRLHQIPGETFREGVMKLLEEVRGEERKLETEVARYVKR